jgi:hypothetical protein
MLFHGLLAVAGLAPAVFGCPGGVEHDYVKPMMKLQGRQINPRVEASNGTKKDWAYEASFNWGMVCTFKIGYRLSDLHNNIY